MENKNELYEEEKEIAIITQEEISQKKNKEKKQNKNILEPHISGGDVELAILKNEFNPRINENKNTPEQHEDPPESNDPEPKEDIGNLIKPDFDMNVLQNVRTPFAIDIVKIGGECFDLFTQNVKKKIQAKIDIYEVINLLDVIGIKKNEFDVKNKILEIKSENPKKFSSEEKHTRQNFCDIVDAFRTYRIDEKLLVAAFRKIDKEEDGTIDFFDLQRINKEKKLNFTDEEIYEMLDFFEMEEKMKQNLSLKQYNSENKEDPFLTFENFCKLYYQG